MSRSDAKRLNDIRRMCAGAAELVARGREVVDADPMLWLALERCIEIAGEAATRLSDDARSQYSEVEWKQLIAIRVRLAHAYFRLEHDLLWEIVAVDFPTVAEVLGPPQQSDKP